MKKSTFKNVSAFLFRNFYGWLNALIYMLRVKNKFFTLTVVISPLQASEITALNYLNLTNYHSDDILSIDSDKPYGGD